MNNDSRGGRRTLDGGGSDSNIMDVCQVGFTRTCDEYQMIEKIGEGTYGQVYKGLHRKTGGVVAMKKMRVHSDKEGYPITAIREIKILKKLQHDHMVQLHEVVTSKGSQTAFDSDDPDDDDDSGHGDLFLVLEYVDHDLTGLIDEKYDFKSYEIKSIMKQLFEVLKYIHQEEFIHRDLKCSNLLLSQNMQLKLAVNRQGHSAPDPADSLPYIFLRRALLNSFLVFVEYADTLTDST